MTGYELPIKGKTGFIINEKTIDLFGKSSRIIVDTSVSVKWFLSVDERFTDRAEEILKDYYNNKIRIISPQLMLFEISNVFKNRITEDEINEANIMDILFNMGIICITDKNILENAVKNAYKYNLSVYDGIFLATAQYYRGKLVTDDEKLFLNYSQKNKDNGVILLKDYGK
jgi:predicted nucleic acid-binding protein